MIVIVGLGNPGREYVATRHNAGFILVEEIAKKEKQAFKIEKKFKAETCALQISGNKLLLVKPQTFMNSSGEAVKKIIQFNNLTIKQFSNLYVIHDDLDILLGEYKIQFGRSSAGHHGVESIIKELGTQEFWRVRIGTMTEEFNGLKVQGFKPESYVLQKFPKREKMIIDEVNKKIAKDLLNALS